MVSKEIMAAFDERLSRLKEDLERNQKKVVREHAARLINTESFDLKGVVMTLAAMSLQGVDRATYEFITEFNRTGTSVRMVQALSEIYNSCVDFINAAITPLAEKMHNRRD